MNAKTVLFPQTVARLGELRPRGRRVSVWGCTPHSHEGASCCLRHPRPHEGFRAPHYVPPVHQERGPHTSCHTPVKSAVSERRKSPTALAPGPKKTSAPPAPQTRRLMVPDQCCAAPLPPQSTSSGQAADFSAHSVAPPAWLRADPAEQPDTEASELASAASFRQPATMATAPQTPALGTYCARQEHPPGPARPDPEEKIIKG